MKRIIYLSVIVLITCLSDSFAQKPGFFVKCTEAVGDTASKYVMNFERLVGTDLSEAFHCATVNTQSSLNARLKWEKEYQLLGGENELNVCSYLKCDYLVTLHMIEVNSHLLQVSAKCINYRKKEDIADAIVNFTTSMNYAGFAAACKEISNKLIKEMGKYEICAFTGPVAITISSDLDSTRVEDYGVFCNQSDQRYHKETIIKNHTFSDWKLERKGIPWTEGTMTFYTDEMTKTTEEDGCHKCKSGKREGGLVTTLTSSMKVKGTGISHESTFQGKKQDDTRIELNFLENGQYLVVAKGTSQAVTGEDKVVTQAEGTCDNQPQETKIVPRDIRVPLRVIFGPYNGKATDKILQQKDTKEIKDPISNEKQTITIDFSLNQKDN
jgi:hypothetical protein